MQRTLLNVFYRRCFVEFQWFYHFETIYNDFQLYIEYINVTGQFTYQWNIDNKKKGSLLLLNLDAKEFMEMAKNSLLCIHSLAHV